MKSSAVVQSLKSWASKLHPQLPLSPKESQRLLTALTSSFRQHLDQAYPKLSGGEDAKAKVKRVSPLKTGNQEIHSTSAAWADKHLTSVLTNPLLAHEKSKQPILDATSAKIELYRNPARDPISLLEEYHEKGAATIPVAVVCLEKLKESVESLPEANRQKAILETQAGKRTLLWLWKNNLHETDAFAENKRLIELMVPLVIHEGFEDLLWEWVQLNITSGTRAPAKEASRGGRLYWPYRWKGYVFSSIVQTKLEASKQKSADAAIDAYLRAVDLKMATMSPGLVNTFPIVPPFLVLFTAFTRAEHGTYINRWSNTDAARYNRLIEEVPWGSRSGMEPSRNQLLEDQNKARLLLFHPRRPSPWLALSFFQRLYAPNASAGAKGALLTIERPTNEQSGQMFFHSMLRTAMLLQEEGATEDAEWVLTKMRHSFPSKLEYIDRRLKKIRNDERQRSFHKAAEPSQSEHVPLPTFV